MKRRKDKKLCKCCGKQKAVFIIRGRIGRDAHHDLCPRCYRSHLDRLRAEAA